MGHGGGDESLLMYGLALLGRTNLSEMGSLMSVGRRVPCALTEDLSFVEM